MPRINNRHSNQESIFMAAYRLKKQKEQEAEIRLCSINDYVLQELGIICPQVKDPKKYANIQKVILEAINTGPYQLKPLSELIVDDVAGEWGEDPAVTEQNENLVLCNVLRNTNFDNQLNINFDDVAQRLIPKDKLARIALKKDDILVEKSGGSPIQPVGRVALIEDIPANYTFSNFLQCIRINEKECLPAYLFAYLRALYGLNYMEYLQNQTTGIKNLIAEEFRAIPVSVPFMPIQRRIATEAKKRMSEAENLRAEADTIVKQAKQKVEDLILGKSK